MCSDRQSNAKCIDDYFSDGILGVIFRYCSPESHDALRRVSKRWNKVADRYVGRVLIVKCGNTFMVDPESNMDRMSIRSNYWMTLSGERGLTENSIDSKTESEKPANNEPVENESAVVEEVEKLQDIPNPNSVRKIGFVGQLGLSGYKPLECILSPCKKITSLYLHMSLFSIPKCDSNPGNGKNGPWLVSCCLPHLKELVIDSSGISCGDSTQLFNFKHTFLSIAAFLCAQKFTSLEKAVIALPYLESTEGILVRALCIFLGRHAESMKRFSYTQKYEIPNDHVEVSENEDESQDSAAGHQGEGDRNAKNDYDFTTEVNYLSLNQLALSAKELKNVTLEELHIVLARKQESAPIWKNLLIKQESMKKCIFAGDKIPLPRGAIEANSQTLVILRLDIRDGVNMECFRTCVHLRHLSLGGRNDANESYEGDDYETSSLYGNQLYENTAQLKNAKWLPIGLETLEIINLRTHKDDARTIVLESPSLRDLTMKNLGWEGNLGLRLNDLTKIYERRKLEHLCIKASLNMISYSELEDERSSPEMNLFACVMQSNSFAAASRFFLEVWKRQDGFYTTKKPATNVEIVEEELDVFQIPNRVELREEEEESDSSDSEEEEEEEEDEGDDDRSDGSGTTGGEEGETEKDGDTDDDEWQECGDGESDEGVN